jgi:hypothetical protein
MKGLTVIEREAIKYYERGFAKEINTGCEGLF